MEFRPYVVLMENSFSAEVQIVGSEKLNLILQAARSTFNQNVTDIFMDCPSRERAGWLCDSFFMGISENLFLKSNETEKAFLQNFIFGSYKELDSGMLPKCFPAEHLNTVKSEGRNNLYIPNWAMFFVVELNAYYKRTQDVATILAAKEKVYALLRFLDKYKNEVGLLENLEGWVFVEWSECNKKERLCGVNFPTNILYAHTLRCVAELYGDYNQIKKAEKIENEICRLGFNGEFFVDNATRVNGVLTPCKDHISETCQYYALFFGMPVSEEYKFKMINDFGKINRKSKYDYVSPSNMFIGNYLRLFWLCEQKEYNLVIREIETLFYDMAQKTGTLWEHNDSRASCNHGFASVVSVLLLKAISGFKQVEKGVPITEENFVCKYDNGLKILYDGKPLN